MNNIIIRHASKANDFEQIKNLFYKTFYPERVDLLAEIFHHNLPGLSPESWYLAEDTSINKIVAGFLLIPWQWQISHIPLKVAEMGLVATLPEYQGKGLMKLLNKAFDQTLIDNKYHLAAIQGIPGFYQKFGYHYALPMENHIILALEKIPDLVHSDYNCRLSDKSDFELFIKQDANYRSKYDISSIRNAENWEYIFNEGKQTEYGSEFWLFENSKNKEPFYYRIALEGFGSGLVITEISENIGLNDFYAMLGFIKKQAIVRQKPYLRFNISHNSIHTQHLKSFGAELGKSYAWQIKIPDFLHLMEAFKPLFEKRIQNSLLKNFTGVFRLNFYKYAIDLNWKNGALIQIINSDNSETHTVLNLSEDLFPALILGHKTWHEMQQLRPDIFPGDLYFNPVESRKNNLSQQLTEILFPKLKNWINCQY